ncbi:MAG TPA: c-type cytochrome [Vicinamibacterales bacterium]|nr:c-type cytochrome [Vicinamibacterales bacterium]
MGSRGIMIVAACVLASGLTGFAVAERQGRQGTPSGWILPDAAEEKQSPLTVDEQVLAAGRAVFKEKCAKCHGPGGLGDGPDADPDARPDMDLTNPRRADRNPDGVVFYKVWNGRRRPKMPAFSEELTEQQVWTVVAYVQTLRRK